MRGLQITVIALEIGCGFNWDYSFLARKWVHEEVQITVISGERMGNVKVGLQTSARIRVSSREMIACRDCSEIGGTTAFVPGSLHNER